MADVYQVARKMMRDIEALNHVSFGEKSVAIVFNHLTDYRDSLIEELDRTEKQLAELEIALYGYLGCGPLNHDELMRKLRD